MAEWCAEASRSNNRGLTQWTTIMRRWLIIVNATAATFFAIFFLYTFLGHRHVDRLARDFVTERTRAFADPVVDAADEMLRAPGVRRFLSDEQLAAMQLEIANYRGDPARYIDELTGRRVPAAVNVPANNPIVAGIVRWKERVRDYYNAVLAGLFRDLRIFAGSNVVAALIATWLAVRTEERATGLALWLSFLLLAAIVYCAFLYVDELSFFKIMFNLYMGWSYPALLALTFLGLYLEHGRVVPKGWKGEPAVESRESAEAHPGARAASNVES